MPFETGTATDHVDLLTKLITFLTTAPGGPGWTLLGTVGTSRLLQAPGISGTDEIGIGFDIVASVGTDEFALIGWMYRDYNAALAHQAQPGHSGAFYHPLWNTGMAYWFIANGQRVIIVTKVSTVYTASYLGKFFPNGSPGEYPQPYYIGMPRATNTRWSSTDERFRNFFDPGEAARLLTPASSWLSVQNYTAAPSESPFNGCNVWPFYAAVAGVSAAGTRYREQRERLDGGYHNWPLVICSDSPTDDVYGELDGVYAIPAFSAASEDTLNTGDYLIVQNCFRTARYYYCAIELA